jgi:glutathione synthase/RimK-type ligase-like ATP-grasp enzyme
MTVCIVSNADDSHAIYVELGLRQKGERVLTWHWGNFPGQDRLSMELGREGATVLPFDIGNPRQSAVWVHRGMRPVLPDFVHQADRLFVDRESRQFLTSILEELAGSAFCVNPLDAIRRYTSKIAQLRLAKKCGFEIPATLISNNPTDIRRFYSSHNGNVVVKHATQFVWTSQSSGSIHIPYTARLDKEHVLDDACLSLSPSIFQPEIEKDFELRVVFIGSTVFAVKIDSQKAMRSLDWRKDYRSLPPSSVFELPTPMLRATKTFVRESGLRYGSIDLIVDLEGRYHFLEVNENGQFLWIEELIPDLPLLDCFCSFLIARDDGFLYDSLGSKIGCRDFADDVTPDACAMRRAKNVDASRWGVLAE